MSDPASANLSLSDNHGSGVGDAVCEHLLEQFKFPVFEILVTFQVILPVFYSFFIPCASIFLLECSCQHSSESRLFTFRQKLSSVLIGSWAHWYIHWELWTWFWLCLSFLFTLWCQMPDRYYEYSVGLAITSVLVCLISNLLSDFRVNLPRGKFRIIFNVCCFLFCTWTLRILYPCCFDVGLQEEFDIFTDEFEDCTSTCSQTGSISTPPPPSYAEVLDTTAPPPSYSETLTRIRSQLPLLQRSISLQAQRWGRGFSVRKKSMRKKSKSRSVHVTQSGV